MALWWTLLIFLVLKPHGAAAVTLGSPLINYADTGSMHDFLATYMTNRPDIRTLTVSRPTEIRTSPWVRNSFWSLISTTLGEYGVGYDVLKMTPAVPLSGDSWAHLLPCTLTRGSCHTICRAPPPEGNWTMLSMGDSRFARWDGKVPAASEVPVGEPDTFVPEANCESLMGLTLATAIQRGGMYVGEANVTCMLRPSKYGRPGRKYFLLILEGPEITATVSIAGGGKRGRNDTVKYSDTTRLIAWKSGVDNLGRLVVSDGTHSVAYTRKELERISLFNRIKLGGLQYTVEDDYLDRGPSPQPRLCGLVSAEAACFIMRATSRDITLGAVTGFGMHNWYVTKDGTVTTSGFVLGTRGVLRVTYDAKALNLGAPEWTEIPLPNFKCSPRLYAPTDCLGLPTGTPKLSAYVRENVERFPFPETHSCC